MRSQKTPVRLILLFIGGALMTSPALAQTVTTNAGFLSCYRRTRDIVLRSSTVAQHLKTDEGETFEAPVQADKLGWRFSFEQLQPGIADRLKTLLVSVCLELHPSAKKDLNAPDFNVFLDNVLETDRASATEGRSAGPIEMTVLITLLNQDTEIGESLGPLLFTGVRTSLLKQVTTLSLAAAEREHLVTILSYPFGSLQFVTPHPFMKFSAAVFGSQDLSVHLRNFESNEFLSMVVHESCHLNSKAATLREKPVKQLTDDDWTFLTLREEFRAGYVTMRFERAWYGNSAFTSTASSLPVSFPGEGLASLFEAFTKSLQYIHPRQERAVRNFLRDYSELNSDARDKLLSGWVGWN